MTYPIRTREFALYSLGGPGPVARRNLLPAVQFRALQQVQIRFCRGRGSLRPGPGGGFRRPPPGARPHAETADDLFSLHVRPDGGHHARPQAAGGAERRQGPLRSSSRPAGAGGPDQRLGRGLRHAFARATGTGAWRPTPCRSGGSRPDQVRDAHLLVVDDVRVTGAHQRCLMRASDGLPLAARTFLYIASFPGPAGACFDPTQEDALNHAAVKTLDDLAGIVEAGDFAWNVRVCKFVLSPANHGDLPRFLGPDARLVRPRPAPQQRPGRLCTDEPLRPQPRGGPRGTGQAVPRAARRGPARRRSA